MLYVAVRGSEVELLIHLQIVVACSRDETAVEATRLRQGLPVFVSGLVAVTKRSTRSLSK